MFSLREALKRPAEAVTKTLTTLDVHIELYLDPERIAYGVELTDAIKLIIMASCPICWHGSVRQIHSITGMTV